MSGRLVLTLALTVAVVHLATAGEFKSVTYRNCKSSFKIKDVQVNPCPGTSKQFCPWAKGSSPTVRIVFEPDHEVAHLNASVRARVHGMLFPYALKQKDACQNSNLECPLQPGQTYVYEQSVDVLSIYPEGLVVRVNWLLNEDKDSKKREVCVIFVGKVVTAETAQAMSNATVTAKAV